MANNKALIISGMHRSGTSMIANWLSSTGLNIGDRLIGATPSNILGHFEDIDIVEFHENLLKYNNVNLYQGIGQPLKFDKKHLNEAKELISTRNLIYESWAWKQPRAILFLSLWLKVLPKESYFLFPFRNYQEVVNSLYNREYRKLGLRNTAEIARKKQLDFFNSKFLICNKYLSMWIRHNSEILNHLDEIEEKNRIVISLNSLINNHQAVFDTIKNNWGFNHLNYIDIKEIYQSNILSKVQISISFDNDLEATALSITRKLQELESRYFLNVS